MLATRRARATVFFKPMISTLASTLLALSAMLVAQPFVAEPFVALWVDVAVFLFAYLTAMPFLGEVGMVDLELLDAVIRGLGFFSRMILPILEYERMLGRAGRLRRRPPPMSG